MADQTTPPPPPPAGGPPSKQGPSPSGGSFQGAPQPLPSQQNFQQGNTVHPGAVNPPATGGQYIPPGYQPPMPVPGQPIPQAGTQQFPPPVDPNLPPPPVGGVPPQGSFPPPPMPGSHHPPQQTGPPPPPRPVDPNARVGQLNTRGGHIFVIPPHPNTTFDEENFLTLLEGSISLTMEEKQRVIDAIPRLRIEQINELISIFEEEKQKFSELESEFSDDVQRLKQEREREISIVGDKKEEEEESNEEAAQIEALRKSLQGDAANDEDFDDRSKAA